MPRPMSNKSPNTLESARCSDRRCSCGKLAARLTADGVEIKCSRCKRVMIVSWDEAPVGSFPGQSKTEAL